MFSTSTLPLFLTYALSAVGSIRYALVFLGAVVEGPVLMIACGFLLHTGYFEPIPLFLALVVGDLAGDVFWYYIGYFFAEPFFRKHGHLLGVTPEIFQKAKDLFHKYHAPILFISKVTLGLGISLATLMAAGATRLKFRTYMFINTLGEFIFVAMLLSIGFFFGQIYQQLAEQYRLAFIVGILGVAAISFALISRGMKKRVVNL